MEERAARKRGEELRRRGAWHTAADGLYHSRSGVRSIAGSMSRAAGPHWVHDQ